MSLASRGSRAAARTLIQRRVPQQPRRSASDSQGHGHGHGNQESALHLKDANPSGNEGIGTGVWWFLASVPVFYVTYSLIKGSPDNSINKMFQATKASRTGIYEKNMLHETVLGQAIQDRARLSSYPRETSGPELAYPEFFNAGSPWNNIPGSSAANLKQLEEHYAKIHAEAEAERVARANNSKITSVYD